MANEGTKWRIFPKNNRAVRRRPCDIIRTLPGGVRNCAKNADSQLEAVQLFLPDSLFEEIVLFTNIYVRSVQHKYVREIDGSRNKPYRTENMFRFTFHRRLVKVSDTNLKELWRNDGPGIELFRLNMG